MDPMNASGREAPWDRRLVERISRGASERRRRSKPLEWAFAIGHGALVAVLAAVVGFYAALAIVIAAVLVIRLAAELRRRRRRRRDERLPENPFGR